MVVAVNFGKKIKALEEERLELTQQMEAIITDEENFDDEAEAEYDALEQKVEAISGQIAKWQQRQNKLEKLEEISGGPSGLSKKAKNGGNEIHVHGPAWRDDPKVGFASERDFLFCVMEKGAPGTMPASQAKDDRLKFLAAAGSDEHSTSNDQYGGYLIPKGFSTQVKTVDPDMDPIGSLVTRVPMAASHIEFPARVDKNHATSVAGGLTVKRRHETGDFNPSRQSWEMIGLKASMLEGLTYATEELINDSPISLAALLAAGFRDAFADKELDERINGSGAGEFEGILNSPALITVAKEGAQAADTINGTNVMKMRARCWRYGRAVWIANHDCYDQIGTAHRALTNTDAPLFVPGNGRDVPDTLLGRPIFFTEYAKTIGDLGDLILGVWGEYLEGTYEPLQQAESTHVRFIQHERTFKFWKRNAGACWWRSPLTPKNGSNTLSPFVTLAERA